MKDLTLIDINSLPYAHKKKVQKKLLKQKQFKWDRGAVGWTQFEVSLVTGVPLEVLKEYEAGKPIKPEYLHRIKALKEYWLK
jgi:hypothetical protein